jgi:hypothetical protein
MMFANSSLIKAIIAFMNSTGTAKSKLKRMKETRTKLDAAVYGSEQNAAESNPPKIAVTQVSVHMWIGCSVSNAFFTFVNWKQAAIMIHKRIITKTSIFLIKTHRENRIYDALFIPLR